MNKIKAVFGILVMPFTTLTIYMWNLITTNVIAI